MANMAIAFSLGQCLGIVGPERLRQAQMPFKTSSHGSGLWRLCEPQPKVQAPFPHSKYSILERRLGDVRMAFLRQVQSSGGMESLIWTKVFVVYGMIWCNAKVTRLISPSLQWTPLFKLNSEWDNLQRLD